MSMTCANIFVYVHSSHLRLTGPVYFTGPGTGTTRISEAQYDI